MADEPKEGEMPEAKVEAPAQPEPKAAEIVVEAKDAKDLEAELEKARKALKEANKEAAERRKKLDEYEAAEKKRQDAEMTEAEKVQARLKELESAIAEKDTLLKQKERQELQRKVAAAVGLPEGLASRLSGDDEEAMTADAQAILELLPKQQEAKKPAPKIDVTNPGEAKQGETFAQKKARLQGQRVNPWGASDAVQRGGGVLYSEKE